MPISRSILEQMKGSSWIRRMFEQGQELKKKYGERNVFDLSLGNPVLEPPPEFRRVLQEVVASSEPGMHRYMPNVGYPETRRAVAAALSRETGLDIPFDHVIMTVGAAGALNVAFKALLDPGDEVIAFIPYFPEYRFYVENHAGKLVLCETRDDFQIDIEKLERLLNERTRAIILNSPNNPTGVLYHSECFSAIDELLRDFERRTGRTIYVVTDEPYRKLVYDASRSPSPLQYCRNTIFCYSHSKDLGIPGERIGFAIVRPGTKDEDLILGAMAFANRTLGYVNAPAIMQRVVRHLQDVYVDIETYRRRRDKLCQALADGGYEFVIPQGAFYIFPKSPIPDDEQFVARLARERVLTVPGSGFGKPGHFRISFCGEDWAIEGAIPILVRVARQFKRARKGRPVEETSCAKQTTPVM